MAGCGIPASTHIVPHDELLGPAGIRDDVLTLRDVVTRPSLEYIQWLAKRRLLRNSYQCQCGGLNDDGTSKVVEIDESKFFHQKYHRGQWREGHWVFGGIERDTGECFLVKVPDRSAATLSAFIERYILPGTISVSDGWRAYNAVGEIGGGVYEHRVIVHEQHFVDPENPDTHTQNVENLWMRTKHKLRRQFGTSEILFTSYLHEFIFRNTFRDVNLFAEFLISISEQYPL